jgi:pimeloyl-ACP methyl ester carboxylesterase
MLVGSDSIAPMVSASIAAAAALPNATLRVLRGHDHLAHRLEPALVSSEIDRFVNGTP